MMSELEKKGGRKGLSEDEYKKLGNEYLKHLHKMVEELRGKGLLKSKIEI
jgi:hypothetical protein